MTSGAWLGSMIPPLPTRIVDVAPAIADQDRRGRRRHARDVVVLGDQMRS